uniref:Xylulose kinase-1 n=1 Tax=Tanacetum cinerariifolium TaxID=118510 RepID=A0A699K0Q9_TANCI|nr:hypothetical protein [Tanacetum cinerariifolium]
MIAYLTKSDASEGFDQIIDFLNASSIKYALTVNTNIYVSCIKQFWSSVSVKKVNDVTRLQALVDKKKVIITEATIREALQLDDAKSINCLPNEEIFTELSKMGYEKPSTKLTFYKAFFSPQWKFLIHTILQCMSAKRTSWNKFSSFMALAVICLSTGRMFNFSKYIFDSLVRNVDSSTKFYMYPRFLQLMIRAQVGDLSLHSTKYSSPALTQKDKIAQTLEITKLKQKVKKLERSNKLKVSKLRRLKMVETAQRIDTSEYTVMDDDDELEPTELKEVVEMVTTKLMTEVVTAASATITAADTLITVGTLTAAPSAARRRKEVVIRDPEEIVTPSIIIHSEPKSKDKGKGIMVEEPKPLKKQAQIEQDEAYARENMAGFKMDYFKGMSYDVIRPIFEKYFNSNVAFLEKTKEQMEEEDSKALNRASKSQAEKAVKKQKLDEEVVELKKHLQIMPNDEDDVYTEATPLARKVPVVDYEIYTENNKPYYKIIRADGSPRLFLSFLSLLRNFDREDLEVLWQLVKERFASSKPKNFSNDFLLTTLTYMFEKPDDQAQVWKNQRTVYGLAKIKS